MAGIAGGAEVIAIPEYEVEPHEVAERLRAAYQRGKTHALVVVAEGAKHGAQAMMQHFAKHRDTIGFGLRVTTLGHVVRGGVPTAADRVLATRLGAAAIDQLARGTPGVLVGVRGNDITTTPLAEVAGKTKGVGSGTAGAGAGAGAVKRYHSGWRYATPSAILADGVNASL
jgi:6-phosphofructokinase 1